ncbi:tubby-like F-box protein 12 [Phragmites australis]|uniref:tubby-like F-box protein 12 n=1 Tax=Phragmites australis TaxID=29695 RepID=UPI002D78399F|nr:tubby-like F-box protein 12 [Phragmites australis]XP_062191669.1 tubby-like F-box protein 12 [Phragmites australis]
MSFQSIVRDFRESFGSLSRRSFEVRISGLPGLSGHHRGRSLGSLSELRDRPVVVDQSRWVGLPPELLRDVMKILEEGESTWPSRKDVVACAAVCRTWREICKDIVPSPEFCGKLTFPVSLKQPGPRDGLIQCFIRRDKSTLTYYLYLCLSPAVLSENGKFLLAAKRNRRTTYTEYIISVDPKNISRSSNGYVGKMRSNFLGTKFIVYDTQPPYNSGSLVSCEHGSRRISSRRVSPKVPTGSYPIARVNYELNVLGTRGPRRMHCTMHSIPASALNPEGVVPGQPNQLLLPGSSFEELFRGANTFSSSRFSVTDRSLDFSSCRFSEKSGGVQQDEEDGQAKERPLVLRTKEPRWHEQLQCWCLNFCGRVTMASVKNFQLIAAPQADVVSSEASEPAQPQAQPSGSSSTSDHDKAILQFGKVAKDMFTMDYRYPLSAFQAFTICLTSFDTKLACE